MLPPNMAPWKSFSDPLWPFCVWELYVKQSCDLHFLKVSNKTLICQVSCPVPNEKICYTLTEENPNKRPSQVPFPLPSLLALNCIRFVQTFFFHNYTLLSLDLATYRVFSESLGLYFQKITCHIKLWWNKFVMLLFY